MVDLQYCKIINYTKVRGFQNDGISKKGKKT